MLEKIGVVAIGRNEGDRLVRCLKSLVAQMPTGTLIVYVDSGSTDGSVAFAESLGVQVVNLDLSIPFTMARGRNAGFRHLVAQVPDLKYVQFIDGDCELVEGWIETAIAAFASDATFAIVCGRRRERFPERSVYNRLADMEWNTPVGEAEACGGDALIRVEAIQAVGGYNETLIAGEEPEMCVRLRKLGWKIQRIDAEMTRHDAAMLEFRQWWKRSVRGGWAMAAWTDLHGSPPERYMVRENRKHWGWVMGLPLVAIGLAYFTSGLSLLAFLGYPLLCWKIYRYRLSRGDSASDARSYAGFCVLGKFPESIGQFNYWSTKLRGQQAKLIEYKEPAI
ncbi:MAG: glycosyltransferase family 2 protein [Leptolyngbya sp. UWPOB_LEPTO1]|uniref:glycosyltransferase n=1 Tax=Leptolyngbya sp. UWPOB_LEPTO1 TaxID=2815653 RepID=UPI001AD1DB38|nr:glycosyltransferase [Leptolyngbya sp. UWPOB_LEPTO1]MBN8562159.1 glycosyltransferase family 2 protein [Leptolyngbya sp. UWPOB_LEPTO1]